LSWITKNSATNETPGKGTEEAILRMEELNVHFFTRRGEIKAIRGLNFSVRKGEILGIVGESGSGKSVTALSIIDLLPVGVGAITSGAIFFEENKISDLYRSKYRFRVRKGGVKIRRTRPARGTENEIQKIRGRISMIFQDPLTSLDPLYSIKAQLLESIVYNDKDTMIRRILEKNDIKSKNSKLLESVNDLPLKEFIQSVLESYGQQGFYQELLLIGNSGFKESDKKVRILNSINKTEVLSVNLIGSLKKKLGAKSKRPWKPKNKKRYSRLNKVDSLIFEEAILYSLELLEFVDMPHPEKVLDSFPHELSGGMKQRIMIALAIANKPEILIADEPTTALDVITQYEILYLLKTLNSKLGLTVLFITHDLGVLAALADRILVMYAGKVNEIGPTESVLGDPLHPYTKGLLKSVPIKSGNDSDLYTIPGQVPDLLNPPTGCAFANRCEFAKDICRTDEPPKVLINNREIHCWLYEDEHHD
jgi:oligopeptide/dipeptide ABC transporter ATP-binding protein